MRRLVRGTLGILAAVALASVAQAQLHPVRAPGPVLPTAVPPIRPVPYFAPLPSAFAPTPIPLPAPRPLPRPVPVTVQAPVPVRVQAPVQVIPPVEKGSSHEDGGDECEDGDGNALNDPDDCSGNTTAAVDEPGPAPASANDSAALVANEVAEPIADVPSANVASEPAPPGWRPSWWMIVLGVGALLLLLGGRRR